LISFIEGVSHGWDVGDFELKEDKTMSFFGLNIKANAHITEIAKDEIADGENALIIPSEATIITLDKAKFTNQVNVMHNINTIISTIIIVFCIVILVLAFKVIFLFRKEKVFEELNVKRCNKIGIFCIIIGLLDTFTSIYTTITASKIVELKFYRLSFSDAIDWTTIIIGLIILVFTEILRVSTNIKQEQDLTI
jgi:ssDNA-specific exonuclease RecJ